MDITSCPQRIISLCTGTRGLERGIERAGVDVRVATYVEIEAVVCENLVQQMEKSVLAAAPVWSDLKTFPGKYFHRKIHGLTGGYPCQPFSFAGKRKGTEDPRHLWPHISKIIQSVEPVWCFFENVPGHLTLGYQQVRSELQSLGYGVKEGIFSAEEVGAPHQRKRLFILAIKLANTPLQRRRKEGLYSVRQEEWPAGASAELANNTSSRSSAGISKQKQRQKGISEITHNSGGGIMLANTFIQGFQIWQEQSTWEKQQAAERSNIPHWPARPGQQQYDWEAPCLESSVGFTVNGYNYRTDLLRMAGNAVVEQTAALAFRTLIKKFT